MIPREPVLVLGEQVRLQPALVLADVVDVVGLEPPADAGAEPPGQKPSVAEVHRDLKVDDVGPAVVADEEIAGLVQVEMNKVPFVDLPDRGEHVLEEIGGQGGLFT